LDESLRGHVRLYLVFPREDRNCSEEVGEGMISAKQIIEAYLTRFPLVHRDGSFEVFENPSFKEMKSADSTGLGIRFTADVSTKTVYVWDIDATIHDNVHLGLGIRGKGKQISYGWSSLLTGFAERSGSKYVMSGSDMIRSVLYASLYIPDMLEMLRQDWSWVDRYIAVTPYLEETKRKLEERLSINFKV
jgi:hypothetical protein